MAPVVLNLTAVSSTSVSVEFRTLSADSINGILTGYHVALTGPHSVARSTNTTVMIFSGLRKYTQYQVEIKACNRAGCGPKSVPQPVTTLQDGKSVDSIFYSCSG